MERNQYIGLILLLIIGYFWIILSKPVELEQAKIDEIGIDSTEMIDTPEISNDDITTQIREKSGQNDSLSNAEVALLRKEYSIFGNHALGASQQYTLENEHIKIVFDTKGGRIKSVELQEHYKMDPNSEEQTKSLVQLFEDSKNRFNFQLPLEGKLVNTEDLYFDASQSGQNITFTLTGFGGETFSQSYTLTDDFTIDYQISGKGLGNAMNAQDAITLQVDNYLDKIESNHQFEKMYSTVYFKENDEDSDYCSCRGDDTETVDGKNIEWVSFVNQFFNTSIVAADGAYFGDLTASTTVFDNSDDNIKLTRAYVDIPFGGNQSFSMKIYSGPNEYNNLKAFDKGLEHVIPFGRSIFGSINRHIIRPFFNWLSQYIGSKGIVIITLIFIIKMLLYPLYYRMLHSQAKMGVLKPQIEELKKKHKDDMQQQQMETMKLYREYGVNPMGGCLPMLPQMPIWYALFRFFPASITFRQEPFLWANDLSTFDAFFHLPFEIPFIGSHISLFTILYTISMLAYTYYNMRHMDMSTNPAMKYVQYIMPVMFFGFFNTYACGLTCYMLFSNLINIAQTIVTKKFIFNDEKILAELNIKKAKPKKKGGFQARFEEALKQQQKLQEQKQAQRKKKKK